MVIDLKEYKSELHQDIAIYSDVDGLFPVEGFLNKVAEDLIDAGTLDNFEPFSFRDSRRGLQVDGYCWNELEKTLTVLVARLSEDPENEESLTQGDIDTLAKRASKFLTASVKDDFSERLDVSSEGRAVAEFVISKLDDLVKFRVIIASDCLLSSRVKRLKLDDILTKPAVLEVWDLESLYRLSISSAETEEFTIEEEMLEGGIPLLKAANGIGGEQTYLGVMPGTVLSNIYHEFGQRLLESNVRTFLDFRAGTNKGMRRTLLVEPENFFAYNNGITVTGLSADIEEQGGQLVLKSIDNMQIVNGGQTTAAIYFGPKEKGTLRTSNGDLPYRSIDLSKVSVQMKLTILSPDDLERAGEFKAYIANYANSQNPVQASDLVSNHPFHLAMERFSRQVLMPAGEGGVATQWFYERSRGQYSTKLKAVSADGRRRFERQFPKAQLFSKTDLAKYENTWRMKPQVVKKGAQANLKQLGSEIHDEYEKAPNDFEISFFRDLVSKAILFRQVDKGVNQSEWYQEERGFKAEAVTFGIALVRCNLLGQNQDLNLDYIYKNQSLSAACLGVFLEACRQVRESITDPQFRGGSGNPSEFCKSETGWKKIQKVKVDITGFSGADLLGREEKEDVEDYKGKLNEESKFLSEVELIMSLSVSEWTAIADYYRKNYPDNHINVALPSACARWLKGGKMPSDKQMKVAVELRRKAYESGFEYVE